MTSIQEKKKVLPQRKFTKPTVAIKHKKVLGKLVENGGNLAQAIRDTGLYSENQALHPEKITESKTWKEVMDEYLSDEIVAAKHNELMQAGEIRKLEFKTEESDEYIEHFISQLPGYKLLRITDRTVSTRRGRQTVVGRIAEVFAPDVVAQDKALDKAFKIKKRYAPEFMPIVSPEGSGAKTTYNFIFSAPIQEQVRAFEEDIKRRLTNPHARENKEPVESESISSGDGSN